MVATSELLSSAILRTIPASETKIIINHLGEGGMGSFSPEVAIVWTGGFNSWQRLRADIR